MQESGRLDETGKAPGLLKLYNFCIDFVYPLSEKTAEASRIGERCSILRS